MDVATLNFDDDSLTRAIGLLDPSSVDRRLCEEYSLSFGRLAESESELCEPLRFLAILCGWRLRPDEAHDPFDCSWYAFSWQNITEQQLTTLAAVAPGVADAGVRARLGAFVWG